jgi:hypothetical protein
MRKYTGHAESLGTKRQFVSSASALPGKTSLSRRESRYGVTIREQQQLHSSAYSVGRIESQNRAQAKQGQSLTSCAALRKNGGRPDFSSSNDGSACGPPRHARDAATGHAFRSIGDVRKRMNSNLLTNQVSFAEARQGTQLMGSSKSSIAPTNCKTHNGVSSCGFNASNGHVASTWNAPLPKPRVAAGTSRGRSSGYSAAAVLA